MVPLFELFLLPKKQKKSEWLQREMQLLKMPEPLAANTIYLFYDRVSFLTMTLKPKYTETFLIVIFYLFVSVDYFFNQAVSYDIFVIQINDSDSVDVFQYQKGFF